MFFRSFGIEDTAPRPAKFTLLPCSSYSPYMNIKALRRTAFILTQRFLNIKKAYNHKTNTVSTQK